MKWDHNYYESWQNILNVWTANGHQNKNINIEYVIGIRNNDGLQHLCSPFCLFRWIQYVRPNDKSPVYDMKKHDFERPLNEIYDWILANWSSNYPFQ